MDKIINYLRTYRKHTELTQYDVATLLHLKGNAIVSRCEKGFRTPTLEMIVVYHLLFDTPISALISNHLEIMKEQLVQRIPQLVSEIERMGISKGSQERMNFLNDAIIRLTKTNHEE